MPDDGSGNFSRLYDWTTDEGNAINILASRMDAEDDGIATALTNRVCKDGQSTMSGNLKMGTNKVTGMGSATAATDAAAYSQVVSGAATYYGLTGGTSTAYTLTPSPAITAYTTGAKIEFQPHTDCGASPTMAISGIASPLGMRKDDGTGNPVALIAGDLQDDQFYTGYSNGTYFIVDNPTYPYLLPENLTVQKKLSVIAAGTLTIATGAVTATASNHLIDGEGATSDDLDTISGGVDGMEINLGIVNASRVITFKHNTGNLLCEGSKDLRVADTNWQIRGKYRSSDSKWLIWVVNNKGRGDLLDYQSASSSASIAFTNLTSAYSRYEVEFEYVIPATNGAGLIAQFSTDNGSSYINSNYLSGGSAGSSSDAEFGFTNNTTRLTLVSFDIDANQGLSNASTAGLCGTFFLYNPSSAAAHKQARWFLGWVNNSAFSYAFRVSGQGRYTGSASAVNAIRFKMSTSNADTDNGNIASGIFKLYGIR